MKSIWKHGSTVLLVVIIIILLVPSWRVSFQGWFQGIFMSGMYFETNESTPIPQSVESWNFNDTEENSFKLSTFKEKPLVISFWATWCPPCRAELKELKELKEELGESIYFLSISEESVSTIEKSGLQEDYDFLYSTNRYPTFFNITSYPTLCIIDLQRNLIFKHSGAGQLNNEKNISFLEGLVQNQ